MSDVNVENLDAILKDPLNADFTKFDGASSIDALTINGSDTPAADAAAPEGKQDEKQPGAPSDASATDPAQQKVDPAPTTVDGLDPKTAVIKTRDGKHEIPFDVLQSERDKTRRLEGQLAELTAKLASSQQAADTGKPDLSKSVNDIMSADELAQLKEDAPVLGAAFQALIDRIGALEQATERTALSEQEEAARRVQAAIDANPTLVYVQSTKPEVFQAICQVDDWVRSQPQFQSLTLDERFAKSLSVYEAAHGRIELPASASGNPTPPTDDPAAKAAQAIANAAAKAGPNTLTDIPGGNPPAANDVEAVNGMSAAALTQMLMGMSQKDQDKFLSRFG